MNCSFFYFKFVLLWESIYLSKETLFFNPFSLFMFLIIWYFNWQKISEVLYWPLDLFKIFNPTMNNCTTKELLTKQRIVLIHVDLTLCYTDTFVQSRTYLIPQLLLPRLSWMGTEEKRWIMYKNPLPTKNCLAFFLWTVTL